MVASTGTDSANLGISEMEWLLLIRLLEIRMGGVSIIGERVNSLYIFFVIVYSVLIVMGIV